MIAFVSRNTSGRLVSCGRSNSSGSAACSTFSFYDPGDSWLRELTMSLRVAPLHPSPFGHEPSQPGSQSSSALVLTAPVLSTRMNSVLEAEIAPFPLPAPSLRRAHGIQDRAPTYQKRPGRPRRPGHFSESAVRRPSACENLPQLLSFGAVRQPDGSPNELQRYLPSLTES